MEKKAKKKKAKDKDKKSEQNSYIANDNVDQDIPYIDEQPDAPPDTESKDSDKEPKDSDKEPKDSDSDGQESDDNCSYDSNENDENDNKVDEIGKYLYDIRIVNLGKNSNRVSFNNCVDQIDSILTTYHPRWDISHLWTFSILHTYFLPYVHMTKRVLSTDHLPIASCPRSY